MTPNAVKCRERRERRRSGRRGERFTYDEVNYPMGLVGLGLLEPEDVDDPRAIKAANQKLVEAVSAGEF